MSAARHDRMAGKARRAARQRAMARPELRFGTEGRIAPHGATSAPVKSVEAALRALIDQALADGRVVVIAAGRR